MLQEAMQFDADPYVRAYLQALDDCGSLGWVEKVLVDTSAGLTFYTVYRGDLYTVGHSLFNAEAQVLLKFPGMRIRFRTLPSEAIENDPLPFERLRVAYGH